MKISILTPDFSHNCFGRAWLLAKLLQRNFDVEIIGPAFGGAIWRPLEKSCDFETKMVKGYPNGQFEFKKMLNMISGDVIYGSKPLMPSFGVGLVKKIRRRKPLVLDIDDWELGFGKEFYDSLVWPKKVNDFLLSISNWRSYYYALVLNKLIWVADEVTVSGRILQARYGGTIIWHGRDVDNLNPEKFKKNELKRKFLSEKNDGLFVVGFVGTPRPHKGLEDLMGAMELLEEVGFLLVIVGMEENSYCINLKKKIEDSSIKDKVIFFPQQPFETAPEFLSIIDLVVIPQRERAASYAQIPAKIFDAMAMAKPVIATDVSDIPEILDGCGWVVEPENPKRLAEIIQYVLAHRAEAEEKGKKAREKCKSEYSWKTMEESLMRIFERWQMR